MKSGQNQPRRGSHGGPWPHPQATAGTFRKEFGKFQKDPGKRSQSVSFPRIPLESTAGIPQALSFKAFEASRAFPEFSHSRYGWERLERATEGISEYPSPPLSNAFRPKGRGGYKFSLDKMLAGMGKATAPRPCSADLAVPG